MNVSLTEELRRFVEDKVASGMYHSASEVIGDGLRLLAEQDEVRLQRLTHVQAKVKAGLDQLDRGDGRAGAEVFARLAARIERLERERSSR